MADLNTCYIASVEELYLMDGETIAERLKEYRNDKTSAAEFHSWCNSIPILVSVIHKAGLGQLSLALEYETPIGGRIDAILLGYQKDSQLPLALIIELKQWTSIRQSLNAESTVSICVSASENRFEDRTHPIQQTITYYKHLKEHHSNFSKKKISIKQCQFLHNFINKDLLFKGNYEKYSKFEHETFVKGDDEKLAAYLKDMFSPAYCEEASALLLEGVYVLVAFPYPARIL